jgi:RHS repeat-associated protein
MGSVVETYQYDAYGNPTIYDASGSEILNQTSQIGNRYLFQGREYDFATHLYYFRARYYNPETGTWLSKDPLGISGGLNLYAFCGNNPVNFVDPSGLCKKGGNGLDDLKNVYKNGKSDWNITIDLVLGVGFHLNINNKGGSILPAKGLMAGVGLGADRSLDNHGVEKTLNVGILFGGASISQDNYSRDITGYGTSVGKGLALGVSQTQEGDGYGRSWEW